MASNKWPYSFPGWGWGLFEVIQSCKSGACFHPANWTPNYCCFEEQVDKLGAKNTNQRRISIFNVYDEVLQAVHAFVPQEFGTD